MDFTVAIGLYIYLTIYRQLDKSLVISMSLAVPERPGHVEAKWHRKLLYGGPAGGASYEGIGVEAAPELDSHDEHIPWLDIWAKHKQPASYGILK